MSTVELHSFHWDNYNQDMLQAHRKVMRHFDLDVRYWCKNIPHGQWLDEVFSNSKADIVGIIEPDLIPLHNRAVPSAIAYAKENESFVGPAQTSNHIHPCTHIFASPAFFFMSRNCFDKMGSPSFKEKKRSKMLRRALPIAQNPSACATKPFTRLILKGNLEKASGRWDLMASLVLERSLTIPFTTSFKAVGPTTPIFSSEDATKLSMARSTIRASSNPLISTMLEKSRSRNAKRSGGGDRKTMRSHE